MQAVVTSPEMEKASILLEVGFYNFSLFSRLLFRLVFSFGGQMWQCIAINYCIRA